MPLSAGSHLGPYEISAAIGAGGMGEVYRARDSKLGRDVALKVLPEAFARDADRLTRFQREAKVLASLDHPNIASIYGLEDSGATHALVMALIEGLTLADRIKQGRIPMDEALRIGKQICEGLEYAHERGIVHRDLKPANIKLTGDDAVKVLDFGLAKAIEGDAASIDIGTSPTMSRMATTQGVLLGTAAYMSPEQAKGKSVDRRADIWAFGCVLYEMLTAKQAFSGETVTDTLAAVVRAEPDWTQLPAKTPLRVRVLLERCLQKDPKQRLRDIGDARISIDEVLSGAADPAAAAVRSEAPLWRRPAPAWAVAACLAVALLALAFMDVRGGSPAPTAGPVRFEIPAPEKVTLSVNFTLSPDGRQLAFAATGSDGVGRIWLRNMDSLEAHPLAGTERTGVQPPFFWSPDSRYIAFDAEGKLKKIEVSSGAAETLCDVSSLVVGGSWSRDGVIVFGQSSGGIMRVPASGGNASPLTTLDASRGEILHTLPEFLPDERHFLYHRASTKAETEGIYVGSIDAKPSEQDLRRVLADDYAGFYTPPSDAGLGELLFVRDRALVAQPFDTSRFELIGEPVTLVEGIGTYNDKGLFSASANGALVYRTDSAGADVQLTWFNRLGKVLGTAGEQGPYSDRALSPDGTHAAVAKRDFHNGRYSLWLVDFSRATTTRFTFGPATATSPIWSADGKRIIFMSNPSGVFDMYQKPADGSAEEELLLRSDQLKQPEDVSRDGRFLLYISLNPKSKDELWVLPLTGDRKPFPFLRTEFEEHSAKFSPDGHWIAYTSNESGRDEVYVRKFSPDETANTSEMGGKWQVSYDGGNEPLWSSDGKQLYYLALDSKVMVTDVVTSSSFQVGKPTVLFQGPPRRGVNTGRYTIDGQSFLFLAPAEQADRQQPPFTVVLNWRAGLNK